MQSKLIKSFIALAVSGLCLCLGTGAGKQVTKPYRITGEVKGVITSFVGGVIEFEATNVGEASHSGRYYNTITGELSLITHKGTSEGLFVCADGSEITWTATIDGTTLTVTATGGTKRFEGGTGGFVAEMDNIVVDLVGMKISYTFKGSGEVTY